MSFGVEQAADHRRQRRCSAIQSSGDGAEKNGQTDDDVEGRRPDSIQSSSLSDYPSAMPRSRSMFASLAMMSMVSVARAMVQSFP